MTSASITVAASQVNTAYVAETSDDCNLEAPCFINSGDDLPGGLGTGLKDAIDALPAGTSANPISITILGDYPVKTREVLLDRPNIIIQGRAGSKTNRCRFNLHRTALGYYKCSDYPKPRD